MSILLIPSFIVATLLVSPIKSDCEIFVVDYQVKCSNMTLKEGDILKKPTEEKVTFLTLENVEGVVDGTTLQNYPELLGLNIISSKIENANNIRNLPHTKSIEFRNCKLPKITAEFLTNCCSKTYSLELTGIDSMEIEDGALKSLKNLMELTIDGYKSFNEKTLEGMNSLQKLFLLKTNLKQLKKRMLKDMPQLSSLSIVNSNLQEIDEDAFDSNPEIMFIWASANKLTEIKPKTFKNLKKLEFLNLMGNNIKDFSLGLLSEQKEIRILRLDTKDMLKMKADEMRKAFPKLRNIGLNMEDRFKPEIHDLIKALKVCVAWRDNEDSYMETGASEDCL